MSRKMTRNRWQCDSCNDIIESKFSGDFQECSCFGSSKCCGGRVISAPKEDADGFYHSTSYHCEECGVEDPAEQGIAVDGGVNVLWRMIGDFNNATDLCEYSGGVIVGKEVTFGDESAKLFDPDFDIDSYIDDLLETDLIPSPHSLPPAPFVSVSFLRPTFNDAELFHSHNKIGITIMPDEQGKKMTEEIAKFLTKQVLTEDLKHMEEFWIVLDTVSKQLTKCVALRLETGELYYKLNAPSVIEAILPISFDTALQDVRVPLVSLLGKDCSVEYEGMQYVIDLSGEYKVPLGYCILIPVVRDADIVMLAINTPVKETP